MSDRAPDRTADRAADRAADRLALAAIVAGAAIAFVSLRAPILLLIGVATAAAGVTMVLRGDRPLVAPRPMQLAFAVTIASVAAHAIIGLVADWRAGQALAEGDPLPLVQASLRAHERIRAACRSLALFSSLSLVIGAIVTRASGKQKGPG